MHASTGTGAVWELPAEPSAVAEMRRWVVGYATEAGLPAETIPKVTLAVSEVVTNVVIHAYTGRKPGVVILRCWAHGGRLFVEVADHGSGVAARDDSRGSVTGSRWWARWRRRSTSHPGPAAPAPS